MNRYVTALFAACCIATGASAHEPPDIVGEAAAAIVAQDAEALDSMRFTAFDLKLKPVKTAAFLQKLEGCDIVAEHKSGEVSMAHEIHYDCPNKPSPPIKCAKDTLVVAIDRASSPDVTAYLQYHPLDTPECRRPQVPGPG